MVNWWNGTELIATSIHLFCHPGYPGSDHPDHTVHNRLSGDDDTDVSHGEIDGDGLIWVIPPTGIRPESAKRRC